MMNVIYFCAYFLVLLLAVFSGVHFYFGRKARLTGSPRDESEELLLASGLFLVFFLLFPLGLDTCRRLWGSPPFRFLFFLAFGGVAAIAAANDYNLRQVRKIYEEEILEDMRICFRMLEKDPMNGAAHEGLGGIYEKKGMLKMALSEYKKAVELDPNRNNGWRVKDLSDRIEMKRNKSPAVGRELLEMFFCRGISFSQIKEDLLKIKSRFR